MPVQIGSRRASRVALLARFPGAALLDVTSRGEQPWVHFSPFYPHGDIPVPLWPGLTAMSVEGIWQALKVFERADVDLVRLANDTMRDIKRSAHRLGAVRGHRTAQGALLGYAEARLKIYLPAYRYVLDNRLQAELAQLRDLAARQTLVLLDYETNADIGDLSRPLSHASLIARYLAGEWPLPHP